MKGLLGITPKEEKSSGGDSAAQDVLDAIKENDPKALALAMRLLVKECSSDDDESYEDEDDDE